MHLHLCMYLTSTEMFIINQFKKFYIGQKRLMICVEIPIDKVKSSIMI